MGPGAGYWFPEGRSEAAIRNNGKSYEILRGFFRELRPEFDRAGYEVINATPGSGLDVFPAGDLEALVAEAAIDVSASTEGMYVNRHEPATR